MKKQKFLTLLVVVLGLMVNFQLAAQVSGIVTDGSTGEALIGASVTVKGSTVGTITDIDGSYSIAANANDVLVFSFVGFNEFEAVVGNRTSIDVGLSAGQLLDEVVVTGYQSQRKRDITGAVATIDKETLALVPASSVSQKLAGKAAGVTISTSGSPGDGTAIRIRGFNSLTNNDPLFVIDGVPTRDNFLNSINPNDIESIQVLKDAASAAVYGARGSNGVIVITTKQGSAGKTKVSYDAYYGVQNPVNDPGLITDPEIYRQYVQAATNATGGEVPAVYAGNTFPEFYFGDPSQPYAPGTIGVPGSGNLLTSPNVNGTDWWDEVTGPAPITEHNLNISGGTENSRFSISSNYMDQQGTINETFFRRFLVRANSSFDVGRFTFGENLSVSRINSIGQSGGNQSEQNIVTNVIRIQPIVPVLDAGGNFAGPKAPGLGLGNNPVKEIADDIDDVGTFTRLFGNVYGEVDIIEGLSARTSLGFDQGTQFTQDATFPNFEAREPNQFIFAFSENWAQQFAWTWTNTLNYQINVDDKHSINALVGYEAFRQTGRNIGGGLSDFFVFGVDSRFINTGLGNPDSREVNSGGFQRTFNSVFAKVDYVFDDWLILSGTVRNDGASEFGANFRRGTFPAGSIGVRLTNWIQNDNIEDFKVRYSYGINGNNAIRPDNAFELFGGGTGSSFYDVGGNNNSLSTGFALQARGNPDGKWEELEQHNFGVDLTLWNGKLSLVFDVFSKETQDLLFTAAVPGTAGSANPAARNIANMTNNGFDAIINYRDNISSEVSFNVGLTLGHYRNEITAISDLQTQFFSNGSSRIGATSINRVGDPIGSFFGLRTDGIFASDAEVEAHANQPGAAVGRIRFQDLDGDGEINDNDREVLGSFHPTLTTGLNFGVNYRDFDLTGFLFGSFGNEIFNFNRLFTDFSQFEANVRQEVFEDAWSPTNLDSEIPAPDYDGRGFNSRPSDYYVEDGSYIRLENIQLGYRVSNIAGSDASVRFYIQGQNLFTITDYTGLDPALSNFRNNNDGTTGDTGVGLDFGNYPSSRTVLFGLNLSF